MAIQIDDDECQMAIEALEYLARNEAGMSQYPNLFTAEDTEEWELAQRLKAKLAARSPAQTPT